MQFSTNTYPSIFCRRSAYVVQFQKYSALFYVIYKLITPTWNIRICLVTSGRYNFSNIWKRSKIWHRVPREFFLYKYRKIISQIFFFIYNRIQLKCTIQFVNCPLIYPIHINLTTSHSAIVNYCRTADSNDGLIFKQFI